VFELIIEWQIVKHQKGVAGGGGGNVLPLREIPPSEDTAGQQLYTMTLDRLTCNFFATASKLMKEIHVCFVQLKTQNSFTRLQELVVSHKNLQNIMTIWRTNIVLGSSRFYCFKNLFITKFSEQRTIFVAPVIVNYNVWKITPNWRNLILTSKQILPVSWPFDISTFHFVLWKRECFILFFHVGVIPMVNALKLFLTVDLHHFKTSI